MIETSRNNYIQFSFLLVVSVLLVFLIDFPNKKNKKRKEIFVLWTTIFILTILYYITQELVFLISLGTLIYILILVLSYFIKTYRKKLVKVFKNKLNNYK